VRAGGLAWLTIRVTGVLLAVLVLLHFAVTHLFTDVAETGSAFVAERWESGIVAATDWVMLVAAVLHGAAGVWMVLDDYASPAELAWARRALVALAVGMVAVGTLTLLSVLADRG
jgi:succinate dehydrogenase hydrophobic anchor subunit